MDKIKLSPELQATFDALLKISATAAQIPPSPKIRQRLARLRQLVESPPTNGAVVPIAAPFTPDNVAAAQATIAQQRWPVYTMLIHSANLADLTTSGAFTDWFDPVSKYELVRAGFIGCVLGMEVFTDTFDEPQDKWLTQSVLCGGPAFMPDEIPSWAL